MVRPQQVAQFVGYDQDAERVGRHGIIGRIDAGKTQARVGIGVTKSVEHRDTAAGLVGQQLAQVAVEAGPVVLELVEQGAAAAAAVGAVRIPYVDLGNGDIDVFIRV